MKTIANITKFFKILFAGIPEIKKTQYSLSIFILAIVPDNAVKKESEMISGLTSKRE